MASRRRTVLAWSAGALGVMLLVSTAFVAGESQPQMVPSAGQRYGLDSSVSEGAKAGDMLSGAPVADTGVSESQLAPGVVEPERGSSAALPIERMIVRQGSMELRVRRMKVALANLRNAAGRNGAEISDLTVTTADTSPLSDPARESLAAPGPSSATVTLRVPADRLDGLVSDIGTIGTVLSQSLSSDDVTEQAIDLNARLRNLRAAEVRLRSLFDRAAKVDDLLSVERELARVRGDIESLDAQLTYLKRQAARATLVVSLTEPGPVVSPVGDDWGFRDALTRGIQMTVALISVLITLAIPLGLLALVVAAIVLPIRAITRRRRARSTGAGDAHIDEPAHAEQNE